MGLDISHLITGGIIIRKIPDLTPEREKILREQYPIVVECYLKHPRSIDEIDTPEKLISDLKKIWGEDTDSILSKIDTSDMSDDDAFLFVALRAAAYSRLLLIEYCPDLTRLTKEQWLLLRRQAIENTFPEYYGDPKSVFCRDLCQFKLENYITLEN